MVGGSPWLPPGRSPKPPEAIRSHQKPPEAIRRHQTPSDAIRRHQTPSDATRSHQKPSHQAARAHASAELEHRATSYQEAVLPQPPAEHDRGGPHLASKGREGPLEKVIEGHGRAWKVMDGQRRAWEGHTLHSISEPRR